MGKTGSWFSAIKKAFTPHSNSNSNSKEKHVVPNESDKKNAKKKKWGIGRLKHGDTTSFIPLKREPSSIEKILGDADREHGKIQAVSSDLQRTTSTLPSTPSDLQRTASTLPSVAVRHNEQVNLRTKSTTATATNLRTKSTTATATNLRTKSTTATATSTTTNNNNNNTNNTITTTTNNNKRTINSSNHNTTTITTFTPNRNHHTAATKIQSIYRGYMARRSFRALKGLVRLQGVIRGQSVKRQTMNAMKYMQFLVKIQTQIQSRRIQTLENQALQRQNLHKNNKEFESSLGRWILTQSEAGQENWDDSLLTKEEIDARMQRKVEAIIKRERALAYAHNHQFLKATPKSLMEIRSGGLPLWWNWIDRQLPENHSEFQAAIQAKNEQTPPRQPIRTPDARSLSSNYKQPSLRFHNTETLTPRSSKSPLAAMSKTKQESGVSSRVSQANISTPVSNARKPRTNGPDFSLDTPLRDDESLTSCPPFSVPNYMVPTVSAKAKVRAHSNPKDRFGATPTHEQKRRLSFPLTQSISSLRWTKGSLFSSKDSSSQFVLGKHKPVQSISNLSVDSTVSLPAGLGRKPFK